MVYLLLAGLAAAIASTGYVAASGFSWWAVAAAYPLGGSAGVLIAAAALLAKRAAKPRAERPEVCEGALRFH